MNTLAIANPPRVSSLLMYKESAVRTRLYLRREKPGLVLLDLWCCLLDPKPLLQSSYHLVFTVSHGDWKECGGI